MTRSSKRQQPVNQRYAATTLLFLFVVFAGKSFGQSPSQTSTLTGSVTAQSGASVDNAYVILGGNRYHDISREDGSFEINGIQPGSYSLMVSRIGFQAHSEDIEIVAGDVVTFDVTLAPESYRSETVVVTATRSARDIEEVPEPITVIKKDEIDRIGSMRLKDILAEQTGLLLMADHGTGIQLQGFNPEYTLIMINGQPLIGRTAGTFDLSRISLGNVQQIEIMKGPSSALWGSDAMAGVINIITEEGRRPFEMAFNSRYGTHQAFDLGSTVSWNHDGWTNNLFINRNSSAGYSIVPGSISQTVPTYENYTATYQTEVPLDTRWTLGLDGRYYFEEQKNTDYLGTTGDPEYLNANASQVDYSLSPGLKFNASQFLRFEFEQYLSNYRTETLHTYQDDGSIYSEEIFDQSYNKSEIRSLLFWNESNTSTLGSGINWEGLKNSDRYSGNPNFRNVFIYGQHEWRPLERLDIITGFRYDNHNEYSDQFSPKFSARYKFSDLIHVRASAGRGFKAPDFRQLFLNFTNPTVGYSVFGSSTIVDEIEKLQDEGKIENILIPLNQLNEIRAERSWAYNIGFDYYPLSDIQIRLNLFRNNVTNLIDSAPVAIKTNGQSAFTYFNLEKIFTQGGELEIRWIPAENMDFSLGYQFLDARLRLNETRTVQDTNGNPVQREFTSYEPMFNRSKHTANVKFFYKFMPLDLEANIRGQWRGKYGLIDSNGSGYVNENEYEEGYALWNAALAKTFNDRFKIQVGVDNLFGFTRPVGLSYLSGRLFYTQVSLQLY